MERPKNTNSYSKNATLNLNSSKLGHMGQNHLSQQKAQIKLCKKMPEVYELTQRIGNGAYGEVYRCGEYAVKVVDLRGQHTKAVQLLLRQSDLLMQMDHQNIIKCYQSFRDKSETHKICIVMEFCEKRLTDILNESPNSALDEERALNIFKQILTGFSYLRSLQIIHRDIKPDNILVNSSGVVKFIDFGFGRQVEDFDNALLKTKAGTDSYTAPQVWVSGNYNTKSQIWSLGVTLYKILFGKLPFQRIGCLQLINNANELLSFPKNINVTNETKQKIKRMLNQNAKQRISWEELFKSFGVQATKKKPKIPKKINADNILKQISFNKTPQTVQPPKQMPNQIITPIHGPQQLRYVNQNLDDDDCSLILDCLANMCASVKKCFQKCFNNYDIIKNIGKKLSCCCKSQSVLEINLSPQQFQQIIKLRIKAECDAEIASQIIEKIETKQVHKLDQDSKQHLQQSIQFFNPSMQSAIKKTLSLLQ